MCGIAGQICVKGGSVNLGLLARMTDLIAYRGPDAQGFLLAKPSGTHAMLSNYGSRQGRCEFSAFNWSGASPTFHPGPKRSWTSADVLGPSTRSARRLAKFCRPKSPGVATRLALVPQQEWMSLISDDIDQTLSGELASAKFIDPDRLRASRANGSLDNSMIWRIYNLEQWFRIFNVTS